VKRWGLDYSVKIALILRNVKAKDGKNVDIGVNF